MKTYILPVVLAFLSACVEAGPGLKEDPIPFSAPGETVQIGILHGGPVQDFRMNSDLATLQGTSIRISGKCMSACTVYLGNPKTCVERGARLYFHGAYSKSDGRPSAIGNILLAASYPPQIATPFMKSWSKLPPSRFHTVTGKQAIEVYGIPECTPLAEGLRAAAIRSNRRPGTYGRQKNLIFPALSAALRNP